MTEIEAINTLSYLLGYENAVDKGELEGENHLNSQEKEALKFILDKVQQYKAIGTVEEFKALKEKNEEKEPTKIKTDEKVLYMCPSCRKIFIEKYDTVQRGFIPKYCEMCGQNIKWSWGQ